MLSPAPRRLGCPGPASLHTGRFKLFPTAASLSIFPELGFFPVKRGLTHTSPQISHFLPHPSTPKPPVPTSTRGHWPYFSLITFRLHYPATNGGLKGNSRARPLNGNEHKFGGLKDTEMHSTDSTRRRGREKGGRKKKILRGQGKKNIKIKNVREEHGFAANWGKPYK